MALVTMIFADTDKDGKVDIHTYTSHPMQVDEKNKRLMGSPAQILAHRTTEFLQQVVAQEQAARAPQKIAQTVTLAPEPEAATDEAPAAEDPTDAPPPETVN